MKFDLWMVFSDNGAAELIVSQCDYDELEDAVRKHTEEDPRFVFMIWPSHLPTPPAISFASAAVSLPR